MKSNQDSKDQTINELLTALQAIADVPLNVDGYNSTGAIRLRFVSMRATARQAISDAKIENEKKPSLGNEDIFAIRCFRNWKRRKIDQLTKYEARQFQLTAKHLADYLKREYKLKETGP